MEAITSPFVLLCFEERTLAVVQNVDAGALSFVTASSVVCPDQHNVSNAEIFFSFEFCITWYIYGTADANSLSLLLSV